MARRSRPVLADVAREAGVSIQTASHVLANTQNVRISDDTRERVRRAAEVVGYRPNRLAQAMKSGKTNLIGIWMPVERPVPTYARYLQHAYAQISGSGYEMIVTGLSGQLAYSAVGNAPQMWPVDGLFAIDAGKAATLLRSDPAHDSIPLCIVGLEEFTNADNISPAVRESVQDVVEALVRTEARKFLFVSLDWMLRDYPREQRRRGFTEGLGLHGISGDFLSCDGESFSAAYRAMQQYLRNNPVPDAVVCVTDILACGVMRALLDHGVSIPQDCQIVGFGDYPEGEVIETPLTTLANPCQTLVETGWKWLRERIENPDLPARHQIVPLTLVERSSTRLLR